MKSTSKYNYTSMAIMIGVIIIAVLLNVILSMLPPSISTKIDVTKRKIYNFEPRTIELVKSIETDINIYALYPEGYSFSATMRPTLNKFVSYNDKIHVIYVDFIKNPGLLKKYMHNGQDPQPGSLVVEGPEKYKVIPIQDLYSINTFNETSTRAEGAIVAALDFVTSSGGSANAYLLTDNEEASYEGISEVLKSAYYEVMELNLSVSNIPENADIIIINNPNKDFTMAQIDKLDNFLNNGGSVYYIGSPTKAKLDHLYAYLAEWGISFNNNYIVETDKNRLYTINNNVLSIAPVIYDHVITNSIIKNILLTPNATDITVLTENAKNAKVISLLKTTEASYAKSDISGVNLIKEESDRIGPFSICTLSEKELENNKSAKVLAISSMCFDKDILLNVYTNATFLNNSVNYLSNITTLSNNVPPKSLTADMLVINEDEVFIWNIILAYIIPLLIMALGIIVFIKRRYL